MIYSKLIGTGSYLPHQIVTNYDLEKIVETSNDWIVSRTGIHSRHIAAENDNVISMSENAAKNALEMSDIDPQTIDLIIVATCSPENFFPSTACSLQKQLGIDHCIAFDVSAACSGFVYALSIADQFVRAGSVKRALIVGSEVMSRVVDWSDRSTCVLFGDGAGAVIIEADTKPGIIASKLYSDGQRQDFLTLHNKVISQNVDSKSSIQMQGREVFKIAIESMILAVHELLHENHMSLDEVDWIIPHQANYRIIDTIISRLSFSMQKVILTIANHANTSSASIPLALDFGVRQHSIHHGQTLLLEAFGGGLTWGSVLLRY